MSYEGLLLSFGQWRDRASGWWTALAVAGLAACAFFLRCFHLLNNDGHYYVIGADSYFFHWLAQRVLAGEGPPPNAPADSIYTLQSGLAYPIAYLSKAIGADSVAFVSKFLPPLLGVISLVVIYLVVSRICNRTVGLLSAFSWAIMYHACIIGGAGYVDRDSLSMLLIMTAAFLFYFSRGWRLQIGDREVGWLVAGLGVLLIEVMISLEWAFAGRVLLLVILAAYFLVRFVVGCFTPGYTPTPAAAPIGTAIPPPAETETTRALSPVTPAPKPTKPTGVVGRLSSAIHEVSWRTFAVIIAGNILWEILILAGALGGEPGFLSKLGTMTGILQAGGSGEFVSGARIAEMVGVDATDIVAGYHLFLIPMAAGVYATWTRRDEGGIFFTCWFLSLLILSVFAKRVLLYAVPAACLLSGLGLVFLWDLQVEQRFEQLKKAGVALLVCLLVILCTSATYHMGSGRLAAPEDWQDSCTYLNENTPQDAVVMTNWTYGYWILDIGQRWPVIDNGYYNYTLQRLHDVGMAYFTADPEEAVQLMEKYGADYLIFAETDLENASTILRWAELDAEYDSFPADSLAVRSLNHGFQSGGGLEVVYRSIPDSEVVILGLTEPEQSPP